MLILVLLVLGASLDLLGHLGNKLVNAHLNGLVGTIADGDVAGLDLLLAQDEHVGNAVDAAGLANLVADLLVAVVADHANAGLLQLGAHLVGVVAALLRNGKCLDLHGRQPGGELARKVLNQNTDEALDGAKAHAMQHDGALLGAVGVHVLQVKVERHLEVELDGTTLPGTAKRVLQVEVDLGAVEGAVALVDLVVHVQLLQSGAQAFLGASPVLVRTHGVLGAGGKLNVILKAKLLVHGVDEVNHAHDLVGQLVGTHKQVGVVLVKAAHAEQAVQSAAQLVAVHQANLAGADGQLAIGVRLGGVHQHAARAVHGLNAVLFVVNNGGVHVVLVVVPVARGLPQLLVHDERSGDLHVAGLVVDLAPVVQQRVLKDHAVGKEEREAGGLVAHHKEVHLAADLAVVALLGLLQHVHVLVELFLGGKGDAVDAGEHLVVLVALPVSARDAGELKGLESLGVADVGADAHVDVVALLVEGDAGVIVQVVDVLDLVLLAALLHKGDGLGTGLLVHGKLEVLLDDLFHLGLDRGEIVLADLDALGQVDVVVEAVVGRGAVGKVGLGVQALDGLRHDVRGRVADDVRDLVLRELGHRTVIVECLHGYVFSSRMPNASACDALGVFDLHHYRQVALVYKRPPHLNGTAGDFLRMLHRVGAGCGARVRFAACPWLAAGPAMDALLDASSAVGADLPMRIERTMAAGTHVANLGIAHRADDEVLLDGRPALRAGAVLGKLALAQGHVQLLLLAVGCVGVRAQDQVGDEAYKRDEGDDAPCHVGACAAAASVDEHIDDRQHIQGDDKANEGIDDAHKLRRHELGDVLGHYGYLSEY